MLEEIAGLGFEWTELSHGVRITLVPGIHKAIQDGIVKVISVHNFCPFRTGLNVQPPICTNLPLWTSASESSG